MTSNDPKHKKEKLTCKARVLVPFKRSPRNVNFREVDPDTTPIPQKVSITRGDGAPLQLEIVRTGQKGIVAELKEIKPGERYELLVGLTPPLKSGRLRSWVRIKTGIEEVPETTIGIYAQIPSGWSDSDGKAEPVIKTTKRAQPIILPVNK